MRAPCEAGGSHQGLAGGGCEGWGSAHRPLLVLLGGVLGALLGVLLLLVHEAVLALRVQPGLYCIMLYHIILYIVLYLILRIL